MTMFAEITLHDLSAPLAQRASARKFCGPYKWRPSTRRGFDGVGFYTASTGPLAMAPHGARLGLRLDWAEAHLPYGSRLGRVRGYWADQDGDYTFHPIIARLPHGRGFLAGWTMGLGMAADLDGFIHDTADEAALAAYDEAERAAEREAEWLADEAQRMTEAEADWAEAEAERMADLAD